MINLSINSILVDPEPRDTLQTNKQQQSEQNPKKSTRKRRLLLAVMLLVPALCLLAVAASALSNLLAPSSSLVVEHLDELQKARIAEMLHLRRSLGDQIWNGFGQVEIPVLVWNETYAFLIGLENPLAGWVTIPNHRQLGTAWEMVEDDEFFGQPYYRQLLPTDGSTPQAFTVQIGGQWAATLQTKEWMLVSLSEQVRQDFGPVFPHWMFASLGMGSSERYISGLLHESFHAFQGLKAPQRLEAGEHANGQWSHRYPWEDGAFQKDWQAELDLLAEALRADTDGEVVALTRQFLNTRAERRAEAGLTLEQIEFERQREWVEGLAKYSEIAAWQLAATSEYETIPEILADPNFDSYAGFPNYWQNELSTLTKRASDEGDGRFYYTGMAQAFLLDRLQPDWKEQIFAEGVWLESLLEAALDLQ